MKIFEKNEKNHSKNHGGILTKVLISQLVLVLGFRLYDGSDLKTYLLMRW